MSALWDAADLCAATGGAMAAPFAAEDVSIDSRTIAPGALFVALATETGDGHDFVADALARGAAGAMVHRDLPGLPRGAKLLRVADTLAGLQALGAFGRARFGGRVVGVTGSVGKTTTKEMLRAILSEFGRTWAAAASHNNHWGVPLTLARLPPGCAFCVVEIGMNHPGEIAPLARLARPHVAAVTAITLAHIGNMGSVEAIVREKVSIAEGLVSHGRASLPVMAGLDPAIGNAATDGRVKPGHDDWGAGMVLPSAGPALTMWNRPAITFGIDADDDACLLDTISDADSNRVALRVRGQDVAMTLAAPGAHMAMNAACALAVAAGLGLDVARAAAALDGFAPVTGRGARRSVPVPGGQAVLLDESYNASSVSVRAALSVLALQRAARRMAVLGDMLELGAQGPDEHRGLAPDVTANADLLFTCGPLMRLLHDAIPIALRGAHAADAATLAPLVTAALRPGDAVLVKGSLGSRMKLVVRAIEGAA